MGDTVDSATQTYDVTSSDDVSEDGDGSEPMDAIKNMVNPRVEIDTSPPFESVKEAVIRFGGHGFWIPRQMLAAAAAEHDCEEFDVHVLEEHTAEMLKDLDMKEQETHDVLKELELTKRLLEDLKLKVQREASDCMEIPQLDLDVHMSTPPDKKCANRDPYDPANNHSQLLQCSNLFSPSSAALIMMELKQAKLNLSQSTNDLAAIRASVESLNKKMEKEKTFIEKAQEKQSANPEIGKQPSAIHKQNQMLEKMPTAYNAELPSGNASPLPSGIARELRELNYEAEQFMKTAEAARGEVLKAMSDVEQTKSGLKLIEMRWVAAKKMEEAARAAEAVALAEINTLSSTAETASDWFQQKPGRISLSFEEYSSLADKARKADTLLKQKDLDFMMQRSTARIPRANGFDRMDERAEERLGKMAFEEVLSRVEAANRRKLAAGEPLRRYGSERAEKKQSAHNPLSFHKSYIPQHRRDSRLLDANESNLVEDGGKPVLRPTTSIGDILSRKLVLRDDLDVEHQRNESRGDRQRVSLNQMLHGHRGEGVTSPPRGDDKRNGDRKHFFSKRKALGFVHISLPMSKQSKSKIQALNLW